MTLCVDWFLGIPFGIDSTLLTILIPPGGIVKSVCYGTMKIRMPNLWIIFTTGLIAGGLTCATVQAGLLATTIAQQKNRTSIFAFLIAKLIAYTVLGFFLGWLGSFFQFSLWLQATLLVIVAIFMIGTALSFLNVHPIFRYFIIQPPRFLTRMVRSQTKNQSIFAPALLGASTIFVPCGTTQAMMALAVASQRPLGGALILATFIIGTFPIFFTLGYFIQRFAPVAAYAIAGMAVWNINTAAILWGSPVSLQTLASNAYCTITFCDVPSLVSVRATKDVTVRIHSKGYSVSNPVIPAGERVTLTLVNDSAVNCAQAFTIPSLGIGEIVPLGSTKTISFVAPTNVSSVAFSCSMGMYGGSFTVVGRGS